MPCLIGCVSKYDCKGIKKPIDIEVLGPVVKVTFSGPNGTTITVGNLSSPDSDNNAVIKSFKYGKSSHGGSGCTVEIMDEEGSSFDKFLKKMNKRMFQGEQDMRMTVTWGWTGAGCNGDPGGGNMSAAHYFLLMTITVNYEGGKLKYTLEGSDGMSRIFEGRGEKVQGNDKQKMPLKQAIKKLFKESRPAVNDVQFLRKNDNGNTSEWDFKPSEGGKNGPVSVWETDQQNPLAAARKWLAQFTTDRDKGITASWDDSKAGGAVIFWEDFTPKCGEGVNPCGGRNLGTYIVNGGGCSPVVSFNPNVQWNFTAVGKAGGGIGTGKAQAEKMKGQKGCNIDASGVQTAIAPTRYGLDVHGPDDMMRRSADAHAAHERANIAFQPCNAELRIQGDPSLSTTIGVDGLCGTYVSIVVINPFHLTGGCGDWLAQPECNEFFSNKAWMIDGVDHDIREGSYVTTLKVSLPLPGSNLNPGDAVGGNGSGGSTLPDT